MGEEMTVAEIFAFLKQLLGFSSTEKLTTPSPSVSSNGGFQAPLRGALRNSGGFDPTGKGSVGRKHMGLDLRAPGGTTIYPIAPGTVKYVRSDPKGGNTVVIDHPNGYSSYYAHCGTISVQPGETVDKNTAIATVGASGNAKGFAHLHLQVWNKGTLIDPAPIISAPAYTAFNTKQETLWLPGAKEVANAWNINSHLNAKNRMASRRYQLLMIKKSIKV